MFQHRGIGRCCEPGTQRHRLLITDQAWAPRNGLALHPASRTLLHDRAFDGRHRHAKAARGFSHGLTVGHRAHQTFFQVGRIGSHRRFPRTFHACLRFLQVALGELLGSVYSAFERETTASLKAMLARYDNSGLAAWFQGLMVQPNLPWRGFVTAAPSGAILGSAEALPEDMTYPKERTLLDFVRSERAAGRRMLIFVEHTGAYDLLPRLKTLLEAEDVRWRQEYQEYREDRERQADVLENHEQRLGSAGADVARQVASATPALTKPPMLPIRVATLRSSTVASAQREAWLTRAVEEGCDVLLCHSGLVEVGLDLLAFPTIVCDEVIFSTTRMRQATRRSYRPGQTLPVKVVQLVYDHSMEARGLALIAAKIKSSLMVEGKLPGEGLSSYSQNEGQGSSGGQGDLLLELARSVLADEAGVTRDVAGSLEATFRELAQVEQEQDTYIGNVELPVVETGETVETVDLAEISETRVQFVEGVDQAPYASETPSAQASWLFGKPEVEVEPGAESAPLPLNHTTPSSSNVQETEHPWAAWRRLHAPLPTVPPARPHRSPSRHVGASQRQPDQRLDGTLWSPQPASQQPMSGKAPSSSHAATGQQQLQMLQAQANSKGDRQQVSDVTAPPPRLQPTQATLWGDMAE